MADDFTRELFEWLNQVAADREILPSGFKLAFVIAQHINRQSRMAWPTQETLADEIGASSRTVRTLVEHLENRGHLTVEHGRGRNVSNRYALNNRKQASAYVQEKQESGFLSSDAENRKPASDQGRKQETSFRISTALTGNPAHDDRKSSAVKQEAHFLQNHLNNHLKEPSEESIARSTTPSKAKRARLDASDEVGAKFAEWYRQYPKHEGRKAAEKAYRSVIRKGEANHDELLHGAMRYAEAKAHTEHRYIKGPAVWLNQGCWSDDLVPDEPRGFSMSEIATGKHRRRKTFGELCDEFTMEGSRSGVATAIEGIFSRISEDD